MTTPAISVIFLNMSFQFIHRLSAIVLTIVLSLCLPMAASPLHAGGNGLEIISDIDVCDEDASQILCTYLSVPEGFYALVNFSAVGYLGNRAEKNTIIEVASRFEKPPAV